MTWSALEVAGMKTGARVGRRVLQGRGYASRRRFLHGSGGGSYHVMSRTVNGERLFGDLEKEGFRRILGRMARFCGVEVLTYALMGNHFHLLVRVPDRQKWLQQFEGEGGQERLLTHLGVLYSAAFVEQVRAEIAWLQGDGRESLVAELLDRFKRRMADLSIFMKELKERFTRWFNKLHDRCGPLWMDRFRSVLVQDGAALRTMAAYIDLNPVRAGEVEDPAESKWTGYGAAVRGSRQAQVGMCRVMEMGVEDWEKRGQLIYRSWLYGEGANRGKVVFTVTQMQQVKEEAERGFQAFTVYSRGVALGKKDFVKLISDIYRTNLGRSRRPHPCPIDQQEGVEKLFSMRRR